MGKSKRKWNIFFMSVGIVAVAFKYIGHSFNLAIHMVGFGHMRALLLSEALLFVFISVLAGVHNGYGSLIAKTVKKNEPDCNKLIRSGFWMTLLGSGVVALICMLCKHSLIRLFANEVYVVDVASNYFSYWVFIIPLAGLCSYIMALFRAMGNYIAPCIFILCLIFADIGLTKGIMRYMSHDSYFVLYIAISKILLAIVGVIVLYIFLRMKYATLCCEKTGTKGDLSVWKALFKAGIVTGMLELPLSFMILWEIKKFAEPFDYFSNFLYLGALVMAPIMAKFFIEKYSES